MEWNKQNVKSLLLVVCGGIAFYSALTHLRTVFAVIGGVLSILFPFMLGGAIAFILNVPMRAMERHMLKGKKESVRRPVALALTLLAVLSVLMLASRVIGPGIVDAVRTITSQIPAALQRLEEWLVDLEAYWPQMEVFLAELDVDWAGISRRIMELLQSWAGSLLSSGGGLVGGVVSGVGTFAIAVVFSFYLLMQKEKLSRQARQVFYALLPEEKADRILDIARLSNRTFSNFLSGQCVEACILGSMFVLAMTIFRMPYALLVGVLIAFTALIPIVGAFIGCGVGALLIAVTDPWKALLFIGLFLLLQQMEGNLIYPHVVGSSVGLPSIWVLVAVTLGGKLMGIVGMLLFIPICSVLYALARGYIHHRLESKGVPREKWLSAPPAEKSGGRKAAGKKKP